MQRFIIRPDDHQRRENACAAINGLDTTKAWVVEVKLFKKKRSLNQNAFLHAVPLKIICDHTGYDIEDMKTYLLGTAYGWEEYRMFGETRKRPMKRSHELKTDEFNWFLEWIEAWAARELQLAIPKPNEVIDE